MPRPIWTGAISFGLVNVPVKLYSAVSRQDVRFHQLRKGDGSRIRQKRVAEDTGEEVPYEEIVKGYEISPDRYVVIDPEELDSLDPKATHSVDIEEFVDLDELDPVFFENAYYLAPDKRAEKPYALLMKAMKDTNKVGIGRFVMRTKQYLAAIRVKDDALLLSTMLFADEVVPAESIDGVPVEADDISEKELKMAKSLIDSLSAPFEPGKYHDDYREKVLDMIERKAEGKEIVTHAPAEEPAKVVDLMAALEASLQAAKERKRESA